jgi:ribonuclease T1
MNPRLLLPFVAAVLLALFVPRWLADPDPAATSGPPDVPVAEAATSRLIIPDIVVRDTDGRVAWRGDVDLAPALARIEAGERDAHRNDGGVFGNREGLLPARPSGHYREYVVRTPGIAHAGPQRLVIGRDGEVFYTSDHYASFRRIR